VAFGLETWLQATPGAAISRWDVFFAVARKNSKHVNLRIKRLLFMLMIFHGDLASPAKAELFCLTEVWLSLG
jgi:hypothetical protein